MSKQYAHLHAMAKTSVTFQNDWPKTVGGVALTSQLLTNGRVTACLYCTCMLTQVRQKEEEKTTQKQLKIRIVLGFNDTSTLEGHCVSSPREREKRDGRDSRGDERGGQGRREQE